jgi:hypothetical protein
LGETIKGLFKAEVIHRRGPWRSFEAVACPTLAWVDWFTNRRPLGPIGNIPPADAEANSHEALETEPMAAQPTTITLRQTRRGSVLPCTQPLAPYELPRTVRTRGRVATFVCQMCTQAHGG